MRPHARAGALTTPVVIGCAGSVHRRTSVRTARALLVDRNRATSPTATKSRHDPSLALPATQTRCFADHRQAVGVLHDVGGAEHIWLATDSHLREWNPCQPLMISRRVADYPDPLTGCSSVRRSSVTRAFTHLLTPPSLLSYPLLAPQQTSLGPSKLANFPTPTTGQNAV